MFKIGNVLISNRIALAPMAGVSDFGYMKICEEMGVGYAVSELISSEAIVRDNNKTLEMLRGYENLNIPFAVQIFGGNPSVMAKAAKYVYDNVKPSIIDINMGCPVPKVALKGGAGSSLLKNPDLVYDIVSAVVSSVPIPVTVKIRSGWDSNSINAVSIARIIEKAGASAICVHPRTRAQGYSGHSDWDIIRDVKDSVSIPVIGNGDINSCYDAKKMLDSTGCDAIMIGRACIGNPWIIRDSVNYVEKGIIPSNVSLHEKIEMIKKHFSYLLITKPTRVVILEMRMHISKYLKGINGANVVNSIINRSNSLEEIYSILDSLEDKYV